MDELLDTATYEGLKELLEDEFPVFLDMFFSENQDALDKISAGLNNDDAPTICTAAHNLKSSSGYIGAIRLSKLAFNIETQASTGSTENIAHLLEESQNIFSRLKTHLS